MTAATRLPDHAPFAPDAIALLNRVIGPASAPQRAWLSGFLAGVEAGQMPGAAAPVSRPKLTILFATESGNSEALAQEAKRQAGRLGFAARTLDAAEATLADLVAAGTLLVIASTWGEGEAPQRAAGFMQALMHDVATALPDLRYAVLALGDRAYAQFCATGAAIDMRLAALGATRVVPMLECDLEYEAPAAAWLGTTLPLLRGPATEAEPAGSVIHVAFGQPPSAVPGKANPFLAEVLVHTNLNSSRSDKQTFHVELDLAGSGISTVPGDAIGVVPENDPALVDQVLGAVGLGHDDGVRVALTRRHEITTLSAHLVRTLAAAAGGSRLSALASDGDALAAYLPGRQLIDLLDDYPLRLDAEALLGALRPLPPRLYSVASSQRAMPDEAHLLVGAVRYAAQGRNRTGVASGWIADRRRVGDRVPVYVKANPHFRLPADASVPLIMVGPGTGVAPFRAFMQERDAAGVQGRSWLFFGDRHYTHDFLYQLEWQDYLKRGVLGRLDVAFSRDQAAKAYVQHRMLAEAAALHAWLQDGARIYVCGDRGMAGDVDAALRTIIAQGAGLSMERAGGELAALASAGRYLRDVY